MIDWNKPIVCKAFAKPKFSFIGFTPDGCHAVVQSWQGYLYKVGLTTGKITDSHSTCDGLQVENEKEPWEKAFEEHKHRSPMHFSHVDYFKFVFELGYSWQEHQKKQC
jgi:hypothetical protein